MAVAAWAGRSYAHLALPTPFLTDADIALLDRAVCGTDGWQPVEVTLNQPALVRRWQRRGRLLVLVVLGWYPLLVTLGDAGGNRLAGRRALRRACDAVLAAGGRTVGDAELPTALEAGSARWMRAVAVQRELAQQRAKLDYRGCAACGSWSAFDLPHCRSCGHRFTSAEDVRRDTEQREAREAVARCTSTLVSLGRGERLFPDWPPDLERAPA